MNPGISELRQLLTGELFLPGDEGWEEGRTLFDSMIDRLRAPPGPV